MIFLEEIRIGLAFAFEGVIEFGGNFIELFGRRVGGRVEFPDLFSGLLLGAF